MGRHVRAGTGFERAECDFGEFEGWGEVGDC
jgi:hypothetical protein